MTTRVSTADRHVAAGYTQYANFSSWDIYRSEMPLQALLAPSQSSAMMRSLLADADQSGWLPKWAYTDVNAGEMNGDSDDPILAEAYAFGARDFDAGKALRDMVHGATAVGTGNGWDVERQDLDEYLTRGWMQSDRRDRTSLDYTIGGSETLEYAIDDNAIARFAQSIGDDSVASTFRTRAESWRHLFNPATGYLAARDATAAFPSGPRSNRRAKPNIGQDGWEEGNSVQYTWSVPQDLRGLFDEMGGNAAAIAKLDTFFTRLNTSRKEPNDWAGNEPALGIPWEYDYAGAPWRTQDVVRRIATTLYAPTPNGEPGNDDLGAMSSWYVWAAIGLYPETPGRADLVLSSPMFPHVTVTLASGRRVEIDAPGASRANRYVQSLHVDGLRAPAACGARDYRCPWLPASVISSGAHLTFVLGATPSRSWGAARGGTALAHAHLSPRKSDRGARKGTVRSRGALRAVAVRPGSARARHPADRHRGDRCADRRARVRAVGCARSDACHVGVGDRRQRDRRADRVRELGAGVRRAREPVDRPRATGRPRDPGGLAGFAAGSRRGMRNRTPHGAPAALGHP